MQEMQSFDRDSIEPPLKIDDTPNSTRNWRIRINYVKSQPNYSNACPNSNTARGADPQLQQVFDTLTHNIPGAVQRVEFQNGVHSAETAKTGPAFAGNG
jgi:hypothetical protein